MKSAIVLGATSGIGKDLANFLADDGYKVGITGRRKEILEELKTQKPTSFVVKAFDIGETKMLEQNLRELVSELGGLDLLVLSSAIHENNYKLDFPIDQKIIDINVSGFTSAVDWAYNYFRNQKSGHLVTITSISGLRGSAKAASYAASKAFQINYLQALRQMASQDKLPIYITDIRPGIIRTPMSGDDNRIWMSSSQKTAQQILSAIKRKRKTVYVTKRWTIIGSIFQLIPDFIYNKLKV